MLVPLGVASREGDHPKITRVADLRPVTAWYAGFAAGAAYRVPIDKQSTRLSDE
jgi:hypothetical protein